MTLLSDWEIRERCDGANPMLHPFVECIRVPGRLSGGLSSCGYDLHLGRKYKVFTPARCAVVDPLNFDQRAFVDHEGDDCLIPPNSFVLAESRETFNMPANVFAFIVGKSSYARCGLLCGCTPIEPAWKGILTIELSNTTPLPVRVHSGQGICQALFFHVTPAMSYEERSGRYQGQTGITLPRG